MSINLWNEDCLDALKKQPSESVDSFVTDPPYGIGYMNKEWDKDIPSHKIWTECYRVLKKGGYILCFSSTKRYHHIAFAIEKASFEIRDMIAWIYGEGMPKGLRIEHYIKTKNIENSEKERLCKTWKEWKTSLKPALEPIVLARKPCLKEGVGQNVLTYGVGALNIKDTRISVSDTELKSYCSKKIINSYKKPSLYSGPREHVNMDDYNPRKKRYPTNFIHDGSAEVVDNFHNKYRNATRFFYCPKKRGDRVHPTEKPIDLMRYLVTLVTPPKGLCCDPFMGTCTTGVACLLGDFSFIGIEKDKEYFNYSKERIDKEQKNKKEMTLPIFTQ